MSESILDDFERSYEGKDWIIGFGNITSSEPFGVKCLRCGNREEFPQGTTIADYCARTAAFALVHRKCEAK